MKELINGNEVNVPDDLPCVECCALDLTCCQNPQILWTMEEIDNLYSNHPEAFEGLALFKGEVPGTMYALRVSKDDVDETNSVKIEYCSMYDVDNRRCSVYDSRPIVCRTYGDEKYAACPYKEYTGEGDLLELLKRDRDKANALHRIAQTNSIKYLEDFIFPWVKRFEASKETNPEWFEWWENLPEPNFIRMQNEL